MSAAAIKIWGDPSVGLSALACAIGLGGFLLWSGLAPLAVGVGAAGAIVVETDRQVIQHLEGGIIREIRVGEGDRVRAGDALVVLDGVASTARRDQVMQRVAGLTASMERLEALQNDQPPDFSVLLALEPPSELLAGITARQTRLFNDQRESLLADLAVLESRRDAASSTANLKQAELAGTRRALSAVQEELALARSLVENRMGRIDRVRALERDAATLDAELARMAAEIDRAVTDARDFTSQIRQARSRFAQDVATELLEMRSDLLAAQEELGALQDVVDRSIIVAPRSGEVLNLRFSTQGGVVGPGEAILEIVPDDTGVLASVRVPPQDRPQVYEGLEVRATLSAFAGARAAPVSGRVEAVSADLKTDPDTGDRFYEVRVRLDADSVAQLQSIDLLPGMPVSVFIYSGRKRTLLASLFSPIGESLFEGLRAQ
jgi:HlyD family type I secretion membrane fusion protein